MRKIDSIALFIVSFCYLFLFATIDFLGKPNPDSLVFELSKATNQEVKTDLYFQLAEFYYRKDNEKVIHYASLARKALDSLDHPRRFIRSMLMIAEAAQRSKDRDISIPLINKAELLAKEHQFSDYLAQSYHLKGINLFIDGAFEQAINAYHKALELNEGLGREQEMIKQLNNIALILREEEKYDLAIEYLNRGKAIGKRIGDIRLLAICTGNVSYIYIKQRKFELALPPIIQSIEMNEAVGDSLSMCTGYYLLSDIQLNLGKLEGAQRNAEKALGLATFLKTETGQIFSLRVLSDIASARGDFEKAKEYAYRAQNLVYSSSSFLYYPDVLSSIVKAEKGVRNFEIAMQAMEKLHRYKDSLAREDVKLKIERSELNYKARQKDNEIKLLTMEKAQSQWLFVISVVLGILVAALAYVIFRAYRQSRRYNSDLESAIEKRTEELKVSNEELERFSFIMSHDLKEPIGNLTSFSSLINQKIETASFSQIKEFAQIIEANGKHLETMLDDILRFNLIRQTPRLNTQELDLNLIVQEIKYAMEPILESKDVLLTVENLPYIMGDRFMISILFKNLIDNAIKFNDKTLLKVHISAKSIQGGQRIMVRDNGIGIEKGFEESIFEMFTRLHNLSDYAGTGLGLATCKKITDLHHFDLGYRSTPGEGTCFYVEVPAEKSGKSNPVRLSGETTQPII